MIKGRKLGLVGKIVLGVGALVGSVFNSGCSDYGNAVSQSVGEYALMEGVTGAVRNEVEGHRGTTVNVKTGNVQGISQKSYPNTILTEDGNRHPAPGYSWLSDNQDDFRVKKKPEMTLFKTYIDAGIESIRNWRYQEAEELFRAAVKEAERFGPQDISLSRALHSLGMVLYELDNFIEAKVILQKSLRGAEECGEGKLPVAHILVLLAAIEKKEGDHTLAKALANKVIETCSELIRSDPDYDYYDLRGWAYNIKGDFASGVSDCFMSTKLETNPIGGWNDVAWILSTCEDDNIRDGDRAVGMAKKAIDLSKRRNPIAFGTLAAAYAESGQYELAVETQKEAIDLLTDDYLIKKFSVRLKLYEQRKPCRETK